MNRLLDLEKELARFAGHNTKPALPTPVVEGRSGAQSYHYAFTEPKKKGKVCVLTIDGGGIRGLIPALILERLERMIRNKKPKMVIQHAFDYFGGTSTGGIIVAALLVPPSIVNEKEDNELANIETPLTKEYKYNANQIASIYKGADASRIFHERPSLGNLVDKGKDAIYVKYKRKGPNGDAGLDGVIDERFGGIPFSALLKPCFLTAMNITTGAGRVFNNVDDGRWLAKDVVRATSAAQTYFDPVQINQPGRPNGDWFADGGLYQNNPSKLVLDRVMYEFVATEARFGGIASNKSPLITSYPNGNQVSPKDIVFVSLGTGRVNSGVDGSTMRNSGQGYWVRTMIEQTMSSNSIANDEDMRRILGNAQYFRLNPELNGGVEMDDISPANLARMDQAVVTLFQREEARINQLVDLLVANN